MATTSKLDDEAIIVGAIVPGDGRVRFCETKLAGLENGDWVVVSGAPGDEAARVVFPAGSVDTSPSARITQSVHRRLSAIEMHAADANRSRAQALIDEVSNLIADSVDDVELISLRFTLDGAILICDCVGTSKDYTTRIAQEINLRFSLQAVIHWSTGPSVSYGSLARDPHPETASAAPIRDRLGVRDASNQFPNGWPRLGSSVRTLVGDGTVQSVSVRHGTVNVLLPSGGKIDVPLEELIDLQD